MIGGLVRVIGQLVKLVAEKKFWANLIFDFELGSAQFALDDQSEESADINGNETKN
jgi:hypothetical protein